MRTRLRRRLAAGIAVLVLTSVVSVLGVSLANAQGPPALGPLSFTPAAGTHLSAITAVTSGGCPAATRLYHVRVTGPGGFDYLITASTAAGLRTDASFAAAFGQTMQDASVLQAPPVPLVAGTYLVTLNCLDRRTNILAVYTGALIFTSPAVYQAGPAPSSSPTPAASPTPSPTPAPSPTLAPPVPGVRGTTTRLLAIPRAVPFQGLPVILIARVSPAAAAGTVQFKAGDTTLGGPVPVMAGFAFLITTTPAPGRHAMTAEFWPTNQAAFAPSTSRPVKVSVRVWPLWRLDVP
ncbi:MAG: Ig-like domain-containing protein [Pseudonocardiaceae bacterium]